MTGHSRWVRRSSWCHVIISCFAQGVSGQVGEQSQGGQVRAGDGVERTRGRVETVVVQPCLFSDTNKASRLAFGVVIHSLRSWAGSGMLRMSLQTGEDCISRLTLK